MIAAVNLEKDRSYKRYLSVDEVDGQIVDHAKEIFRFYVARGVITESIFKGNVWKMNNERSRTTIRFDFSDDTYREKAQPWAGCGADAFRLCAKTYCAFKLGSLEMSTIHLISCSIVRMAECAKDEIEVNSTVAAYVVEMLEMLPGTYMERECAIEPLRECARAYSKRTKGQRLLSDFRSYFRFSEELGKAWGGMETSRRLAYFPVYFWWNLTVILPLRVTEFLMTPRDCLVWDGSSHMVTIRRTRLKGGGAGISYKIESDYEKEAYPVSDGLADAVEWYIEKTEAMAASPIDSLFRREAHVGYFGIDQRKPLEERPYSYQDISKALNAYYEEELDGKGIGRIRLGDTRHIAMMNLIISGGSPSMCMELAGHEDINISSHYYANMSNLVECATYELYRKKEKSDEARIFPPKEYPLEPASSFVKVNGGWCRSPLVKKRDTADCLKALGEEGEIGFCLNCRFFRPDGQGITSGFYNVDKGKRQVDRDSWFLMHMIEAVRRGIGCQEDIGKALLRLRYSCGHYQECILAGMREDGTDGETQEDRQ